MTGRTVACFLLPPLPGDVENQPLRVLEVTDCPDWHLTFRYVVNGRRIDPAVVIPVEQLFGLFPLIQSILKNPNVINGDTAGRPAAADGCVASR